MASNAQHHDSESENSENEIRNEPEFEEWGRQPMVRDAKDNPTEEDMHAENQYVPEPTSRWCSCGKCFAWNSREMNTCCKDHTIWNTVPSNSVVNCVTQLQEIQDLIRPGPLRVMYYNFCAYHVPKFSDAEQLVPSARLTEGDIYRLVCRQRRLCAYRSIIFWTFQDIRRGERRPLPSCIYDMVRAAYPGTDNEEEYANIRHSEFEFAEEQ